MWRGARRARGGRAGGVTGRVPVAGGAAEGRQVRVWSHRRRPRPSHHRHALCSWVSW